MDDPRAITRPDPALHTYYLILSLCTLVLFPLVYVPYLVRYRTLRYRFDDDGVSMSWGKFFQQETYLTYRRIQDIQVTRGVLQRSLGLATLQLQTASGGSGAEMKIEGIRDPDRMRDFLYERMRGADPDTEDEGPGGVAAPEAERRGARGPSDAPARGSVPAGGAEGAAAVAGGDAVRPGAHDAEVLALLREIRDELRRRNAGVRTGGVSAPGDGAPPPRTQGTAGGSSS